MKNHPSTYDLFPIDLKPMTPDAEIPSFSGDAREAK